MNVGVTGASGFIGTALVRRLCQDKKLNVKAFTRQPSGQGSWGNLEVETIPDLQSERSIESSLRGIDTLIHLAARAHVSAKTKTDIDNVKSINIEGTRKLALDAKKAGVKRFIFLSSIKAMTDDTSEALPITERSRVAPKDVYGVSKLEAENVLLEIARKSRSFEVIIIRPPLIYGPGVKANFLKIVNLVKSGLPLPFLGINNKRSVLFLYNLTDFIELLLKQTRLKSTVFLVKDERDLSTSELCSKIADSLAIKVRQFYIPPKLLKIGFAILGKQSVGDRLLGSLQVDDRDTLAELNWKPKYSIEEALKITLTTTK